MQWGGEEGDGSGGKEGDFEREVGENESGVEVIKIRRIVRAGGGSEPFVKESVVTELAGEGFEAGDVGLDEEVKARGDDGQKREEPEGPGEWCWTSEEAAFDGQGCAGGVVFAIRGRGGGEC